MNSNDAALKCFGNNKITGFLHCRANDDMGNVDGDYVKKARKETLQMVSLNVCGTQ